MSEEPMTQRDAEQLRQAIDALSTDVRGLRDEMARTYVRSDVLDPRLKSIEATVSRHDDWLTWAQRIVLGAVIVALLGLVLVSNGVAR